VRDRRRHLRRTLCRWLACTAVALAALGAREVFASDPPRRTSARQEQRDDRQREDSEDDPRPGSGPPAPRKATLAVTGPVRLRLNLQSGRVSVHATGKQEVDAALSGSGGVRLSLSGDRVEVGFSGPGRQRDARVRLEVPRGTAVDLETLSADVEVEGTGAEVRVHTLSGDVRVAGVAAATLETVSGDLEVDGAKGPVRVHTVSGDAEVSQDGPGTTDTQLEFESTSGDLRWSGACGPGCRLDAQTLSGNLRLALAPQSGFELSFSTRSGEVHDGFGLAAGPRRRGRRHGLEAKAGGGEGRIECDTFSGDLELARTGK
jgi:hypothetical protein